MTKTTLTDLPFFVKFWKMTDQKILSYITAIINMVSMHPYFRDFVDHTSPLREGGACGSAKLPMTWMGFHDVTVHPYPNHPGTGSLN